MLLERFCILLTGATGFLGGAAAVELLDAEDWPRTRLLVRASTPDDAMARLRTNLARFAVPAGKLDLIKPEQIICGDLTDVDAFATDKRLEEVTHVINCAAVTSFGTHPKIWTTNVDGTLAFARRVQRLAHLRRFIQVGTAMICGDQPRPVVQEDDYPQPGITHLVDYAKSKSEAEIRLRELFGNRGPLVIVRPSIIVGHSRLGCEPSHSIFWTFRMMDTMRCLLAEPDDRIDVVPVDFVARALVLLLHKPSLAHSTYHLSAGPQLSSSFREIGEAFAKTRGDDRQEETYRTVTYKDLVAMQGQFHEFFGRCNKRFMLKAMKLYGSFSSLGVTFDNRRLLEEGMAPPPRFTDYLPHCLETSRHHTIYEQMMIDFQ